MGKLGAFDRLRCRARLVALPLCAVFAWAPALATSANPIGGNVVAGTAVAQIAISASAGAGIGDVGARQPNIGNNQTLAGVESGAFEPAFGHLPPEINSGLQLVQAAEKYEKDEINLDVGQPGETAGANAGQSNIGDNAPAIAATEAQYEEMWAQDVTAMYGYVQAAETVGVTDQQLVKDIQHVEQEGDTLSAGGPIVIAEPDGTVVYDAGRTAAETLGASDRQLARDIGQAERTLGNSDQPDVCLACLVRR